MTTLSIEITTAASEARAIGTLVKAFALDPAVRWTFPDRQQYLDYFPDFVRALGGNAFKYDTADCVEGSAGVALWLPPSVEPDESAIVAVLEKSLPREKMSEVFSVIEQMGKFHPDEPHWYLPFIGVDPDQQGHGYGAMLLRHALARCDREKSIAYLESSNPRNISLYVRHGFKAVGRIQTRTSPPIIPMVRLSQ